MAADDLPQIPAKRQVLWEMESWAALTRAWAHAVQSGFVWRAVVHLTFLAIVSAGWFISAALLSDHNISRPASPRPTEIHAVLAPTLSADMFLGGTGGESEDLLLFAVVPHTTIPRRYRVDPITYTVQPGDNVSSIADQFDVSVETILWNNGNLEDNPDYLDLGDILTILPVSGVYHTVVEGDTLDSIAAQYKASVEDIVQYEGNYMVEPYTIQVGDKLIVPGGRKPYKVRHVEAWSGEIPAGAQRGTGVFGWPMSGFISQGYSEYHPAVDIAAPQGTPIKAADSGYVAVVGRSDTGYGRYVVIDHGNGFQTLYAHFSVIYVDVGQSVGKGETIGLCGSTGKSTGPHVHFEVKLNGVRRNPLIYLR